MELIEKTSISINASQKVVFDFIINPKKTASLTPGLTIYKNLPTLPVKAGDTFNYEYSLLGSITKGIYSVISANSPSFYEVKTTGNIHTHWKYYLDENNGVTNVDVEVTYSQNDSSFVDLAKRASEAVIKKLLDKMMYNIKQEIEKENATK